MLWAHRLGKTALLPQRRVRWLSPGQSSTTTLRRWATSSAAPVMPKSSPSSPAAHRGGGSSLLQRLTSFVAGAGLMAIFTQFYIYDMLRQGNQSMIDQHRALETRIRKLEGTGK